MIEHAKHYYQAEPEETVTLEAAITGDAFVEVGPPMQPAEGSSTKWVLKIPKTGFKKAYVFKASVEFEDPPPGSQVDFTISGSKGGSFTVYPIDPSSNNKLPAFNIEVA